MLVEHHISRRVRFRFMAVYTSQHSNHRKRQRCSRPCRTCPTPAATSGYQSGLAWKNHWIGRVLLYIGCSLNSQGLVQFNSRIPCSDFFRATHLNSSERLRQSWQDRLYRSILETPLLLSILSCRSRIHLNGPRQYTHLASSPILSVMFSMKRYVFVFSNFQVA